VVSLSRKTVVNLPRKQVVSLPRNQLVSLRRKWVVSFDGKSTHPERFVNGSPKHQALPSKVWINKPIEEANQVVIS